jgi:deazaflavin-dependent oxidoreductase (nitroreductase family)
MNASNIGEAAPDQSTPAVVRPSRFVRVVIGPMTKVLNPVMLKLAGRRHAMIAAQVRHVGRKSGRRYVTPVGVGLTGGIMVIPLTFGNQSDWSRNIRAADGGSVRLNGVDYQVSKPELADWGQAVPFVRAAFHPVMRAGFRMLGIRQFLLLTMDDG